MCPKVEKVVEVEKIEDSENGFYSALVKVRVDLVVGKGQKVLLFLNERSIFSPAAYIFSANSRSQDTNYLVFTVRDVKRGKYLARVQIDGAESLLSVGENQEYDSPAVIIGKSKLNPS
ncbi:MAG: hypothetical protein AAFR37_08040 [Cyanobacteria bacterium J06628_3]